MKNLQEIMIKSSNFWGKMVVFIFQGWHFRDYQRQIREKERGSERNFVPLISGMRFVPLFKKHVFPFRFSKMWNAFQEHRSSERHPKALKAMQPITLYVCGLYSRPELK